MSIELKKVEVGSIFYRVSFNGSLREYKVVKFDKDIPVYEINQMTNFRNDEYKLLENIKQSKYVYTSTFGIDVMEKEPDEWYSDIKKALKVSEDLFYKVINPHGKYRVAIYFDDVFDGWKTGILTKKEAYQKIKEFNKIPRAYVSFRAVAVKESDVGENGR